MGKRIDLTGQRFGKLTVEEYSHISKRGDVHWNCKCDCGNIKTVGSEHLRSGNTKSCGCLRGDVKRIDLTGQRFGKLTVEEYSHADKNKRSHWKCVCDCGNIKLIRSDRLKVRHTKSCGCEKRQISERQISERPSKINNYYKESECGTYMEGYILRNHCTKDNSDLSIFEDDNIEIEKIEESFESAIKVALLGNPDFIFDKTMYGDIKKHTWYRYNKQVSARINDKTVGLNRYILDAFMENNGRRATFKNDKYFDYRFENIIFADYSFINGKKKTINKTGFRGVKAVENRYEVYVKGIYIGAFKAAKEAAKAYNKKAIEVYGKHAYQNKIN